MSIFKENCSFCSFFPGIVEFAGYPAIIIFSTISVENVISSKIVQFSEILSRKIFCNARFFGHLELNVQLNSEIAPTGGPANSIDQ